VAKLLSREGPANADATYIVIEPAPDPPAPPPKRADHLDTSAAVADAKAAAVAGAKPVQRVRVTVDGDLLELPHDDAAQFRDFVEAVYVLHGLDAVLLIDEELETMVRITDNGGAGKWSPEIREALKVQQLMSLEPLEEPSLTPQETGPARIRSPRLREAFEVQRRMSLEPLEEPPLTPQELREYEQLKLRIGLATSGQVGEWRTAFAREFTSLRLRVLAKVRKFEEAAVAYARTRMDESQQTVIDETMAYFQSNYGWHDARAARAVLEQHDTLTLVRPGEAIAEVRASLAKVEPAANTVLAAREKLETEQALERAGEATGELPPSRADRLRELREYVDECLAAYGAALAVEAAEHPVLYRFDPETLHDAVRAADQTLGDLLYARLKKTFVAAGAIRRQLREYRPAKGIEDARVENLCPPQPGQRRPSGLPEVIVAADAEKSVWAYPTLLADVLTRNGAASDALLETAIGEIRAEIEAMEKEHARGATLAGIGLAGLSIALTAVCPPAGLALDVGLSASDIHHSAEQYEGQSNEALCDLNPRRSLAPEEPSAVPVVLAVAGAAMVAL
jgi:hypothetical protein